MSYVVLARKYRPRSFAQMVGQEHVVQALTNALTQGRLHHAYLFTGTRGIGKTTVSRILAKSLNCTGADGRGGITAEPCGVCQACTEIDADRYLDYIELDAASNRSIDEIRDLIERAAYKPGIGRYKVFMIDEAHQLTKDAFNALLKTLEEPPDYLKFVLATTDPEKMLPTVLSRCLQFNLRPMAPATVRDHLRQVLASEGVPFDDGSLRRPCWRPWTGCAAWVFQRPARWRKWPCCCSRWRSSRRCPAPWTRKTPKQPTCPSWPACWPRTRRSCSTAWCCTAVASCS